MDRNLNRNSSKLTLDQLKRNICLLLLRLAEDMIDWRSIICSEWILFFALTLFDWKPYCNSTSIEMNDLTQSLVSSSIIHPSWRQNVTTRSIPYSPQSISTATRTPSAVRNATNSVISIKLSANVTQVSAERPAKTYLLISLSLSLSLSLSNRQTERETDRERDF